MTPHTLSEYARDVAFVTLAMIVELQRLDEGKSDSANPYHVFGGFMGFSAHAGEAGLALAKAFDGLVSDAWIEIVDDYAARVIGFAIASGHPATGQVLKRLAFEARGDSAAEGGAP